MSSHFTSCQFFVGVRLGSPIGILLEKSIDGYLLLVSLKKKKDVIVRFK